MLLVRFLQRGPARVYYIRICVLNTCNVYNAPARLNAYKMRINCYIYYENIIF